MSSREVKTFCTFSDTFSGVHLQGQLRKFKIDEIQNKIDDVRKCFIELDEKINDIDIDENFKRQTTEWMEQSNQALTDFENSFENIKRVIGLTTDEPLGENEKSLIEKIQECKDLIPSFDSEKIENYFTKIDTNSSQIVDLYSKLPDLEPINLKIDQIERYTAVIPLEDATRLTNLLPMNLPDVVPELNTRLDYGLQEVNSMKTTINNIISFIGGLQWSNNPPEDTIQSVVTKELYGMIVSQGNEIVGIYTKLASIDMDMIKNLNSRISVLENKVNSIDMDMIRNLNSRISVLENKLNDVYYRTANYNNGVILHALGDDEKITAVVPLYTALGVNVQFMKWGFLSYQKDKSVAENMDWNVLCNNNREEMAELHSTIKGMYNSIDSTQNQIILINALQEDYETRLESFQQTLTQNTTEIDDLGRRVTILESVPE